jgi:acyl carrier protein
MSADVKARVEKTVRAVFRLAASERLEEVVYKEHPRWDSLGHIQLILALEKEFGVKFSSEEVVSVKTADDLAAAVSRRQKSGS